MPNALIRDPTTQLPADFSAGFLVPSGYIDGMKMVWNSATSISVTNGTMYIQSLGYAVSFPSLLTLSGLSLTASTLYHLYGYLNSGVPAIELVTTAPAAAYSGTARSKTGDTSRRYVGSVLTNPASAIYQFIHSLNNVTYFARFGLLSGFTATTPTTVSAAAFCPLTAVRAYGEGNNNATNAYVGFGMPGITDLVNNYLTFVNVNSDINVIINLNASQNFNVAYSATPSSGHANLSMYGYDFER